MVGCKYNNVEKLFIELLQVALEKRNRLSIVPMANEWDQLHELFKNHALLGVGYVAIQKLPRE